MTVRELRKALKGVSPDLQVYCADHDHQDYETNGRAAYAEVFDQSKMEDWLKDSLRRNPEFIIDGKYFVIRVG